jgi:hypothetical protein
VDAVALVHTRGRDCADSVASGFGPISPPTRFRSFRLQPEASASRFRSLRLQPDIDPQLDCVASGFSRKPARTHGGHARNVPLTRGLPAKAGSYAD